MNASLKTTKNPHKQLGFLKKTSLSYGGELLKTRRGRERGRPIDTRNSMHLVLRSSQAQGEKSFKTPHNARKIQELVKKFSEKYGVQILSLANVGTHLHFHLRLSHRQGYYRFIRALTGAIAMAVSGRSRWVKDRDKKHPLKFWDYRPFTRVVVGLKAFLTMKDYVQVNQLEGLGVPRLQARMLLERNSPLRC